MIRKDIRSQSIDLLRFPLALFVTAVHIFVVPPYLDMTGSSFAGTYPAAEYILRFVGAFISDQSVPIYYFIAGFVFFLGLDFSPASYPGKLKRRCHSLLIPYILWNTVAILYMLKMYLPGIRDISQSAGTIDLDLSLSAFINCYWDNSHGFIPYDNPMPNGMYPIDAPLWFVRDLIIMVLISPAIHAIYKLPVKAACTILSVVTIIQMLRMPGLGHTALLLEAFTFFSWGGFLSYHKKDMMEEFKRFRRTSFILYPILAVIIFIFKPYAPQAMAYVKSINVVVGLFFFYNVAATIVTNREGCSYKFCSFLSPASFFIYCSHYIIIDPIGKRLFGLINPTTDTAMVSYLFLLYFTVIGVLLAAYSMMRHFTPRFLKLFTGGRL